MDLWDHTVIMDHTCHMAHMALWDTMDHMALWDHTVIMALWDIMDHTVIMVHTCHMALWDTTTAQWEAITWVWDTTTCHIWEAYTRKWIQPLLPQFQKSLPKPLLIMLPEHHQSFWSTWMPNSSTWHIRVGIPLIKEELQNIKAKEEDIIKKEKMQPKPKPKKAKMGIKTIWETQMATYS